MKRFLTAASALVLLSLLSCQQPIVSQTSDGPSASKAVYVPGYEQVATFSVGDYIYLRCEGVTDGYRWLDGQTDRRDVSLAPLPGGLYTGTKWKVLSGPFAGTFVFESQGDKPGNKYLDGQTPSANAWLAPAFGGQFSGTVWKVIPLSGNNFALQTQAVNPGNKYLNGETPNRKVYLAPYYGELYSGAVWSIWKEVL